MKSVFVLFLASDVSTVLHPSYLALLRVVKKHTSIEMYTTSEPFPVTPDNTEDSGGRAYILCAT